ncbi:ATP-binding protein [Paenibacillus sp. JX-17]|uniref:histidine kinase n=1 Tax=Paenibacillus lacisoli TaxID=3064525 RepID=A0ABT9CCZ5_9BACL|nr:ATP-binding protein [Paenibacillus sp. JX-17]
MSGLPKAVKTFILFLMCIFVLFPFPASADTGPQEHQVTSWEMKWGVPQDDGLLGRMPGTSWMAVDGSHEEFYKTKPADVDSAWVRVKIPVLREASPALLFNNITAKRIIIYKDKSSVYESYRTYNYDQNRVLLPLQPEEEGSELLIWLQSNVSEVGITGSVQAGTYGALLSQYMGQDLSDIIMGSTFILTAVVMLFCSIFLNRDNLSIWLSLSLVILTIGILIVTYSPFLFTFYKDYGQIYLTLFDVSLFVLLPSLTIFFEKIIGIFRLLTWYRHMLVIYSLAGILFMIVNTLSGNRYYHAYYLYSVKALGILIVLMLLIIVSGTIRSAVKGNKEGLILTFGFILFALACMIELLIFYVQDHYHFVLWKWGMVGFVISLIVILGRRLAHKHEQVVKYSKELEMFNNELQRSEKMEIISDLAASVAHEVRNPLQVTRGFLQLMNEQNSDNGKGYLKYALEELDRASEIITDFLTFAKPEFEQVSILNIIDEFRHIEGILNPMASLEGGRIYLNIPDGLRVQGNSSKFKQAFINMIKNSIEAFGPEREGEIRIWAYAENEQIVIHIQDNGEGMSASELSHLGEPYFSNKTKGTGLGMMVTFRIIEAMKGRISYTSAKGVGTEAVVRFPAAG